jgi:sugar phosphate isomerase/epimerase
LPFIIREGINPEISFNHLDLDRFGIGDFREMAERIADAGLSVTFHAPFLDLRPGALDPAVRRVTVERLKQVFALIPLFRPRTVVCHPTFDARYYVASEDKWLEASLATWRELLPLLVEGTAVVLENVYERGPEQIQRLLEAIGSPQMQFCFDTGHANVFSDTPLEEWLAALGDRLGEVHLHDNHGAADEHLPVGEGTFPFANLAEALSKGQRRPVMTIEPHSEGDLWRMVTNLGSLRMWG